MDALESRLVKADLVLLFKIIHGFVDIDYSAMFDIQFDRTTRFVDVILTLMLANSIFVIV